MNWFRVCVFVLASTVAALSLPPGRRTGIVLLSAKCAKVTVLLRGKPVSAVKVELLRGETEELIALPYWFSSTQAEGIVSLPYLPPGRYELRLAPEQNMDATLILQIPNGPALRSSRLIAFEIAMPPSLRLQGSSEAAQTRAILRTFTGTVEDVTGAVIAWSNVSIRKRDRPDGPDITEAVTDGAGHFSTDLPVGEYVAVFQSRGFLVEVLPFEIASRGWDGLLLKLRIGGGEDYYRDAEYSTQGEISELRAQ